tara:strand:- start:481 stop:861 length:381 start_codon:yes stop_codon:yes gene_type:complete
MKKFFIIIIICPLISFGQLADTCFTSDEIIDISETLDSLYYMDSLNNKIITEQDNLISDLETIIRLDSIELIYTNIKLKLLNENIDLYIEREKHLRPKWYDHKAIWFSTGILTTLFTGKMIVKVIN